MRAEKIKALFFLISGEIEEEMELPRLQLCNQLCETALITVEQMKKENLAVEKLEDYLPALENLAAANAWYHLMLLDEAIAPETMNGQTFAFTLKEQGKKAKVFWEQCRVAAAPALKDSSFYFGGTNNA